jgi:ssDNA-binding Zn-finger/Zn-ribbon topoisomerase 1
MNKTVQVYDGDGKCPKCGDIGLILMRKPDGGHMEAVECTCPAGIVAKTATVTFGNLMNCPMCDGTGKLNIEVHGMKPTCNSCGGDGNLTPEDFMRTKETMAKYAHRVIDPDLYTTIAIKAKPE